MKHILTMLSLFACNSVIRSQISMQTNIPPALAINSDISFEVKIKKGDLTNFSKYQLEVPDGMLVEEVDSKTGSFSFEENRAKIIWVITPPEAELTIRLKLNSGAAPGPKTLLQRYFYMENDNKKEVEMEAVNLFVKDSAAGSTVTETAFRTLIPKMAPSLITTTINPNDINTKNPAVLKQQVAQLKKDSKDAFIVGEREKAKAEEKLKQANESIASADRITNADEKKTALEKANVDKQKAEYDLEVASKVLVLAKSLDDNANEIENINRVVNPGAYSGAQPVASANAPAQANAPMQTNLAPVTQASTAEQNKASSSKDLEKLQEIFKPEEAEAPAMAAKTVKSEASSANVGIVFKVQVGAFGKEPLRSDFKSLGKIAVVTENGMYKVLVGSFVSKDEALEKRQDIISKGFDGFVVSYKDGVRVK